jgi:hypothetical protein
MNHLDKDYYQLVNYIVNQSPNHDDCLLEHSRNLNVDHQDYLVLVVLDY